MVTSKWIETMISATSGIAASAYFTLPNQTQELSDEQKTGLEDVLSQYDTENLSDSDAAEIVESIKELEIRPGAALGEALTEAGIDPKELRDQAGIGKGGPEGAGGPGGPGGPGGKGGKGGPEGAGGSGDGTSGVNEAAVEILESVLEALQEDEDTSYDSFQELLNQQLEEAGIDSTQSIVDIRL